MTYSMTHTYPCDFQGAGVKPTWPIILPPEHCTLFITVLEGGATSAGGEAGVSLPQIMPSVWVHLKFSETEGLGVGRMDHRTRTIANVTLSIKNAKWVSYRLSSGWHCAKFWWMRSAESQKCPDSCKSSRTQEWRWKWVGAFGISDLGTALLQKWIYK